MYQFISPELTSAIFAIAVAQLPPPKIAILLFRSFFQILEPRLNTLSSKLI